MIPTAEVDLREVTRSAQPVHLPDARVRDYAIVQAGFALRRLSEREAEVSLRCARELAERARREEPGREVAVHRG